MDLRRRLLRHGLLLFLLGLLTGLVVPAMTNPRAGLAAHLEGVMNGMFLVVVALAMVGGSVGLVIGAWRRR